MPRPARFTNNVLIDSFYVLNFGLPRYDIRFCLHLNICGGQSMPAFFALLDKLIHPLQLQQEGTQYQDGATLLHVCGRSMS